ncbi:MAG: 50S ribosomal protein L6 [Candidatus Micrarchaeia archaeon]
MKIPEGVKVEIANGVVKVAGPKGSLSRAYNNRLVSVTIKGNEVEFELLEKTTRAKNASFHTVQAHVRNMFAGANTDYERKLKVVYAHFPISLEVKGDKVLIKNFFGEKTPREAKILPGVKVEIKGQDVIVKGADKDAVGQTASNLAKASYKGKRDERVFQDGIYYDE